MTDAAVAAGSLSFAQQFICTSGGCPSTGDPAGLVSLTWGLAGGFGSGGTPPNNFGTAMTVQVTFNPDGTLTGFVRGLDGIFDNDLTTSGSEFDWTGFWNGPTSLSCPDELWRPNTGCLDPGYWYTSQALPNSVPEPPSIWILLTGLAAMLGLCGALRWKS